MLLYHLFTSSFLNTEYLATYSSMEKAESGLYKFMKDFGYDGYRRSKLNVTWTSLESDREFYIITNKLDIDPVGPKG